MSALASTVPELLTVDDVAARFKLSRDAIYRAVRRGEVSPAVLCGKYRFRPDELDAWFERSRVRPRPAIDLDAVPAEAPLPPRERGNLRSLREQRARRAG